MIFVGIVDFLDIDDFLSLILGCYEPTAQSTATDAS
jgi:hypothetical protein